MRDNYISIEDAEPCIGQIVDAVIYVNKERTKVRIVKVHTYINMDSREIYLIRDVKKEKTFKTTSFNNLADAGCIWNDI